MRLATLGLGSRQRGDRPASLGCRKAFPSLSCPGSSGSAPAQSPQQSIQGGGRACARGTPPGRAAPARTARGHRPRAPAPPLLVRAGPWLPGPRAFAGSGARGPGWGPGGDLAVAQVPPQAARDHAAAAPEAPGEPNQETRPSVASGARYSTPAGLGSVLSQSDWPGCFANFPPRADRGGGVGGGWGLGSRELGRAARFPPAAQGFAKQRARASPWAWGGSRGGGERLAREGGRGGDRGWKPGSRAGARSWSKRTRGPWAGCHLFAGAVWAASSGHPLSGSPRWGWGWSLATRAQPEQPEHRVAGGRLRSSTKCPGALGSQPASARSLCRAERPGPGRPRVRGERDERGERGQLRGLLGPKPAPEHCVNLLKPSDPLE